MMGHSDMDMGHGGHDMPNMDMCAMSVRSPCLLFAPRLSAHTPGGGVHDRWRSSSRANNACLCNRCSSPGTRKTSASSSSHGTSDPPPASSSPSSPLSSSVWAMRPCAQARADTRSSCGGGSIPPPVSLRLAFNCHCYKKEKQSRTPRPPLLRPDSAPRAATEHTCLVPFNVDIFLASE